MIEVLKNEFHTELLNLPHNLSDFHTKLSSLFGTSKKYIALVLVQYHLLLNKTKTTLKLNWKLCPQEMDGATSTCDTPLSLLLLVEVVSLPV